MKSISVDILIDNDLRELIKRVSKKTKMNEIESAKLCFSVGLEVVEKIIEKWTSAVSHAKMESSFSELNSKIKSKTKELMDLNARIAIERFDAYAEFERVGNLLIRYSSKRAEARRLYALLQEKNISYDLSPGELRNFDELAERYLFKKRGEVYQ